MLKPNLLFTGVAVAALSFVPTVSQAARSMPSNTPVVVDCKTQVIVGKTVPGTDFMLQLEVGDPIFSNICDNGGVRIINGPGTRDDKLSRSYTLDCNYLGVIRGTKGRGVELRGYGMNVANCYVRGFTSGIVSSTDGGEIENNTVEGAVGDGFVVKGSAPLATYEGVGFDQNYALNNGGWGFLVKGNSVLLSGGSQANEAVNNAKGGFFLKGNYHEIFGATATGNGGPGILVDNNSCCTPNTLESVTASNNAGPGVIFLGRDDDSNCLLSGTCFPSGFTTDFSPDGIRAVNNGGACPTAGLAPVPGFLSKVCAVVRGKKCAENALFNCRF